MFEKSKLSNVAHQLATMLLLPKGRINRVQFGVGLVLFILIARMSPTGDAAKIALVVAQVFLGISIFGKRLHDIGKSAKGFVIAAIVAVLATNVLYPYLLIQSFLNGDLMFGGRSTGISPSFILYAAIAFWVGMTLYLFSKRGEDRVNEYGAPPHSGLLSAPAGTFSPASKDEPTA